MKKVKYTKVKCFTVNTEYSYLNFTYKSILKTLKLGPQTTISYSGKRKKANFFFETFFTSFVSLSDSDMV